jgi:hypothetical protein
VCRCGIGLDADGFFSPWLQITGISKLIKDQRAINRQDSYLLPLTVITRQDRFSSAVITRQDRFRFL